MWDGAFVGGGLNKFDILKAAYIVIAAFPKTFFSLSRSLAPLLFFQKTLSLLNGHLLVTPLWRQSTSMAPGCEAVWQSLRLSVAHPEQPPVVHTHCIDR